MTGHHLVLGELEDFLTGKTVKDTHDERLRQGVARALVVEKGYQREEIRSGEKIPVSCNENRALVPLDFRLVLHQRTAMIVKYGPGSILTRRRPALALSRLVAPYQVPFVVVTNGRDAEVLSGDSGRRLGEGLDAIPSKARLLRLAAVAGWAPLTGKQIEMESRILYAYEIDGACPCDDTICKL
jgi:hypothetical protein